MSLNVDFAAGYTVYLLWRNHDTLYALRGCYKEFVKCTPEALDTYVRCMLEYFVRLSHHFCAGRAIPDLYILDLRKGLLSIRHIAKHICIITLPFLVLKYIYSYYSRIPIVLLFVKEKCEQFYPICCSMLELEI